MHPVYRGNVYKALKKKKLLTEDHLFRVVRTFTDDRSPAENLVPGHMVGHKLNNPEYEIVEYHGLNEPTDFKFTTLEAATKKAKEANRQARKAKLKAMQEEAEEQNDEDEE